MNRGASHLLAATGTQGEKARRLGVTQAYVSQLGHAKKLPPAGLRARLAEVFGIPPHCWDEDLDKPQGAPAAPNEAQPDTAAAEVQQLLREGRPLGEVYAVAQRYLATLLSAGLSPDHHRAWTTLLRSLKDAIAERGRTPPLQEHPDWDRVISILLDGVAALPGGPEAVLQAVRRAMGADERAVA